MFFKRLRTEKRSVFVARPSKPVSVLKAEGRSHRTKKELAARERGENELLTGKRLHEFQETKEDAVAHAEFLRVSKLLKVIGKNDDLYANSINRYCSLHSEIVGLRQQYDFVSDQMRELEGRREAFWDVQDYFAMLTKLQKSLLDIDKQVQAKRSMMLALEKENLLTIASALRSVPKQPPENESVILKILSDEDPG